MSDSNKTGFTAPIDGENSIAELTTVELGGVEQWVLTRGRDVSKPVLLFLHGGPGTSEMPLSRAYLEGLERDFIFVNWDQRGAGKSYQAIKNEKDMNIGRFMEDTRELALYLMRRFNKEKIYIFGHSWGTMLGVLTVQKYPALFYAYAGVGQVVNLGENEKISYDYTRRQAFQRGNNKAIYELKKIGRPPYLDGGGMTGRQKMGIQRRWLGEFGGSIYGTNDFRNMDKAISNCTEYTDEDRACLSKAVHGSFDLMGEEYKKLHLIRDVDELKIPVYFLTGRFDYQVPFELSEGFYKHVKAPYKEWVWFEKSCHGPMYEEPGKFMRVLRERFKHHKE